MDTYLCKRCTFKHIAEAYALLFECRDVAYRECPLHRASLVGALSQAERHATTDHLRLLVRMFRMGLEETSFEALSPEQFTATLAQFEHIVRVSHDMGYEHGEEEAGVSGDPHDVPSDQPVVEVL